MSPCVILLWIQDGLTCGGIKIHYTSGTYSPINNKPLVNPSTPLPPPPKKTRHAVTMLGTIQEAPEKTVTSKDFNRIRAYLAVKLHVGNATRGGTIRGFKAKHVLMAVLSFPHMGNDLSTV